MYRWYNSWWVKALFAAVSHPTTPQKMFQIMYSSPGAGAITSTRSARPSRESSASHPAVPLPKKDLAQISHARDPMLLYLHCEREGETKKTVLQICDLLEQCVARGMTPLKMRQVWWVGQIFHLSLYAQCQKPSSDPLYRLGFSNHKLAITSRDQLSTNHREVSKSCVRDSTVPVL